MQVDQNYSDTPLISVQLMSHSGDFHLLPRAYHSILEQDLPLQIQILFDGSLSAEEAKILDDLTRNSPHYIGVIDSDRKYGYYCVPRNKGFHALWGFYVAHLDADNEWRPGHLRGLLESIRTPGEDGIPHFTYSRREYVADYYKLGTKERPPLGPSPLAPWTPQRLKALIASWQGNFVDTSDFLIGRSALYELAERTGHIWDPSRRRFGDWDLMRRLALCNIRGRAVDQVTHIYHWTGDNLQLRRPSEDDLVVIPQGIYEQFLREGKIRKA